MKVVLRILIPMFLFFSGVEYTSAQDALYTRALELKKEHKYEDALAVFRILLGKDSSNVKYNTETAFLLCKVGNNQVLEATRSSYFTQAEYIAKRSIKLAPNDADTYYTYALALGRINENANSKEKITNAKLIRSNVERAIELNPAHSGAWHILGRWHRTLAGFNAVEKLAINALFGGMPEGGSYDAAIECFTKCVKLEPKYMLHVYELAVSYFERNKQNDKITAAVWFKKVMEMPITETQDLATKEKTQAYLKKLH